MACTLLFLVLYSLVLRDPSIPPHRFTPQLTQEKPMRFLVMVQTESCLPSHLNSEEAFGNITTCECDVLVLNFEQKCNQTSPTHIQYIFKSNTSWNEGRNLLLEVGRSRSVRYLYYIFIDDDIQLFTNLNVNPWRTFLDILKEVEPAIGVVDYTRNVKHALNAMKKMGCGISENSTQYFSAPNFDSAFNAFHYQAVDHILPYPTKFDNISWWWSGFYCKVKCDITFPGHTVMLSKINIINPQHRPYPRKLPNAQRDWNVIMREVEARLPQRYRNSSLLKAWKEVGLKNEVKSASHCFPLPTPHLPIKPYSYP